MASGQAPTSPQGSQQGRGRHLGVWTASFPQKGNIEEVGWDPQKLSVGLHEGLRSPWEEGPGAGARAVGCRTLLSPQGEPQLLPSFPQTSVPKSASPTSRGQVSLCG